MGWFVLRPPPLPPRRLDEPELLAGLDADLALEPGARHRQVVLAAADREPAGGVDADRAEAVHRLGSELAGHAAEVELAADGATDHAHLGRGLGEDGDTGVLRAAADVYV